MPRDPNGVYTLPPSYRVQTGDTVLPVQHNPPFEDVANALTESLARDGRTEVTGDLKMGGHKITNAAPGVLDGDVATLKQVGQKASFKTVQELLDDSTMSYDAGPIHIEPGDIIEAQGFRYEVAAPDATDADVETAGGIKLVLRSKPVETLPQALTEGEQTQARRNISARRDLLLSDYIFGSAGEPELIITSGSTGADDENIREIGNILYEPDDEVTPYKIVYSGNKAPYMQTDVWAYGATSLDGRTWTKIGKLVARASEDPFIVKHAGTYFMYVEDKAVTPFRNIRLFTTTDFVNGPWVDQGVVLDIGTGWERQDVSSPTVIVEGGIFYLFYEGRGAGFDQIGLATSSDGINFTKSGANPVIGPRDCWGWAANAVPDDIRKVGGKYVMLAHPRFDRDGYIGSYTIGVAISDDLMSWRDPLGHPISLPAPGTGASAMFFEREGQLFVVSSDPDVGLQVLRPGQKRSAFAHAVGKNITMTLPSSTYATVPLTAVVADMDGAWDLAGNQFVAPWSGLYSITSKMQLALASPPNRLAHRILVNSTQDFSLSTETASNANPHLLNGTDILYLNAGDTVKFQAYAAGGNNGTVSVHAMITQVH